MNPYPKPRKLRSRDYKEFVQSLPCSRCGRPGPSHAHHLIGIGHMGGQGTTAGDEYMMPLCAECHGALHLKGVWVRDQWEWVARTQAAYLQEVLG